MLHLALLLALSGPAVLLDQSAFNAEPDSTGWHVVSQRAEIAREAGWIAPLDAAAMARWRSRVTGNQASPVVGKRTSRGLRPALGTA